MLMPRTLLLFTAILLAAVACAAPPDVGAEDPLASDGRFEQVAVDDVRIWRSAQPSGDGLGAEVAGTVGFDVDCGVYLHSEEFDRRHPVVWPEGTGIADADPVTLQLADGTTVAVGAAVSGGGGYHSDLELFPEGCAESGETAVFNPSGDIQVVDVEEALEPPAADPASPVVFDRCTDLAEPPPAPDGSLSTDADVAAAQQARAEMALPSDIATVEALLAGGTEGESWPLGFPHTEEELEAVMARNGDLEQLEDLQVWAASAYPDTWGGLWLDQTRGGLITVAFTEEVDARVADITDRYGVDVRGVEVAFPEAQLNDAQEALDPVLHGQWEGGQDGGPQPGDLMSTSVHAPTNRLHVGLYTDDERAKEELAEIVDPAMVCLDIEEIPTAADAGPADWAPSPDADLSAESTTVALDVIEQACASATSADGRIVVQELRYEEDAIVAIIGVIPRPGLNDCPGNPITSFTLELDEPLGGRQLLDGAGASPSEPTLDH